MFADSEMVIRRGVVRTIRGSCYASFSVFYRDVYLFNCEPSSIDSFRPYLRKDYIRPFMLHLLNGEIKRYNIKQRHYDYIFNKFDYLNFDSACCDPVCCHTYFGNDGCGCHVDVDACLHAANYIINKYDLGIIIVEKYCR